MVSGRYGGWPLDLVLALALAGVGLAIERATGGRLFTESILLWIGLGGFLLLRLGATLAGAGRTLGCGFVFLLTWVGPCLAALYLVVNPAFRRVVRDSPPFFLYLGAAIIVVMLVTFERLRLADERRLNGPAPE